MELREPQFECNNDQCPLKTTGTKAAKLMSCSRCLAVAYCSAACQKQHFKHHREDCAMFVQIFNEAKLFEKVHSDKPEECRPTSFNHARLLVCLDGNKGKGSLTAVKQCLASMTPLELANFFKSKSSCAWPHLMRACTFGRFEVIQELVKYGADVNEAEADGGGTPLMCAVREGRPDVVTLLLEKGADVHQRLRNGSTVLQVTLYPGEPMGTMGTHSDESLMRMVTLLVDRGVDVNAHTVPGEMKKKGGGEAGEGLKAGKSTDTSQSIGEIGEEKKCGLEEGSQRDRKTNGGMEAKEGDGEADNLSEQVVNDEHGYSPAALYDALSNHKIAIAHYLLDHGAVIGDEWMPPYHYTALMLLATNCPESPSSRALFERLVHTGQCDVARRLRSPGQKETNGMTAWLFCFHAGGGACPAPLGYARALYATGLVDVNEADDDGYTALHYAANNVDHAAVMYLLSLPRINPRLTLRRCRLVEDGGRPNAYVPYSLAMITRMIMKRAGVAYTDGIQRCNAVINLLFRWKAEFDNPGWVCPIRGVQWFQKPMSEWVETDGK